jgi:uncharacterized protein
VRIALDSSVLIAAHISRAGVCAELLEDLLLHHELVTSEFVLGELGRKLVEKFRFPKREAEQVIAFLRRVAVVVEPVNLPSDVGGDCALLVSVDRHLLDMHRINEIPIIRPGEYWRRTT